MFIQKCRVLHKVSNQKCTLHCFLFFYFSIFQFWKFSSCKNFNLNIFLIKKCCFSKIIFIQKCRVLHKVSNQKCTFHCFLFFYFSIFQFWKFSSCKNFNLIIFLIKKCCFSNIIFIQKCRVLHKGCNQKCTFCCFSVFLILLFSFLVIFPCKIFNLIIFFIKKSCFTKKIFYSNMPCFT